jgi:hypothetical protein
VIQVEYSILAGQRWGIPAGDERLLDTYAKRRTGTRQPDISDWFWYSAQRAEYRAAIDAMAARFLEGIARDRAKLATEPDFAKVALKTVKVFKLPRSTQALLRALIYCLDPKMALDANDAIDLAHCIRDAPIWSIMLYRKGPSN